MNIFITLQSYPIKTDYSGGWPIIAGSKRIAMRLRPWRKCSSFYYGRTINFIVKTCASYSILAR